MGQRIRRWGIIVTKETAVYLTVVKSGKEALNYYK